MTPESDRERDAAGRPLNARPRDELGRPLPRGSKGVEPLPEVIDLSPIETLEEAERLLDQGLPFQAHEVLEAAWKAAPPDERDLWQGLAQLAVALTHALRGNAPGADKLLARGGAHISGYAQAPPYAIDINGLLLWCETTSASLIDPEATIAVPNLRER